MHRTDAAQTEEEQCGAITEAMIADEPPHPEHNLPPSGCELVKGHLGEHDKRVDTFGYTWTETWLSECREEET